MEVVVAIAISLVERPGPAETASRFAAAPTTPPASPTSIIGPAPATATALMSQEGLPTTKLAHGQAY
jgi:hypothetical protein